MADQPVVKVVTVSLDELEVVLLRVFRKALQEIDAAGRAAVPDFLKSKEVAKLLRTTPRTVCNLALSGELEHTKIGADYRFPRAAVMALVQARAGSEKKPGRKKA